MPAKPSRPRAYRYRSGMTSAVTNISIDTFENEARDFLDGNARKKEAERKFVWGEGSDKVAMFEERNRTDESNDLHRACEWRAKKYDAGFGWITGPVEYGGRGLPGAYEKAWNALEAQYQVPNQAAFTIGLGMVAPTILAHGSEAAKQGYLGKMYRADIVGCQLFSEPGAGSDLASLQTKAERDGDEWVITGQKVWTTGAHYSDIGEIIARTDPELPKHKGLTGFIVDMKAPGVEVRPLRQMTGGSSFNEVFFNEVHVPDADRLGDLNNGWNVALTTLMNERAAIGAGGGGGGGINLYARVIEMVRHLGIGDDPVVRDRLADLIIHGRVSGYNNQRAMDKIKAGQLPGPEMSIAKLAGTQNMRRLGEFVSHVLGPKLIADTGEWGTYAWSMLVLGTPGGRIAGGSDEIMRNIVGERVLGLPKEPGIDSKSPFRELKVGTQGTPGAPSQT
jgi:alkylation response protein AidB-like acyl-CoA dehydrogenase